MQHFTLITLALATSSSANFLKRQADCSDPNSYQCQISQAQYLVGVCQPTNDTGSPDLTAPCNQVSAITAQCVYGADGLAAFNGDPTSYDNSNSDADVPMLSNGTQRDCVCSSQFFNVLGGCSDCYKAHGVGEDPTSGYVDPAFISSASSSYCAVTNTPTVGFAEVLYAYVTGDVGSSLASVASTASVTSTFSDPIGNNTAVSLYYTPSITGSSAWVVAQATETPSNSTMSSGSSSESASGSASGSASSAQLATSNGQIVPTAGASSTASRSGSGTASGSAAASASGSSGAGKKEAAAIAGVVALAGFVALS
ncbi:hypothetical protein LTR78_000678 [Recurvomyces mirabilis]|uniref:Uncharacterized protein n=1 Tax=Recurvomyces mirabilis TaxID=574656 RepID=A0AAE1C6N5_9PEZI|nr:hypothetical protein LTR78_000678 [Recurvomyces mirabilis]KAK5162332.1 hypothetical protein LTS14_000679 [Recurvomyces mirabilis]